MARYLVVQPYGRDIARQSTVVGDYSTLGDAYEELDRLAERMAQTGVAPDCVTLLVVDDHGRICPRPDAH